MMKIMKMVECKHLLVNLKTNKQLKKFLKKNKKKDQNN